MNNNTQGLGVHFKQNRKPVEELCLTDEVLTAPYFFEARVERTIWEKNSFGAKPYLLLKTVHVQRPNRGENEYLGTLDDSNGCRILLPITDTISEMGLKSMDIINFKARLKYNSGYGYSIIVYQARNIEVIGSFISQDEEGVEDYE